jgi:Protein of unknown function (DUF3515)
MHGRPLLGLTAASLLLAGCSSAVRAVPFDGADDSPQCHEVADEWPATVAGLERRETAVESETVAAWGDPAIIARCGAPVPGPTTEQCVDVDGVDWVAVELSDGVELTTYGRDPAIEVLVPQEYADTLLLPAFGDVARLVEQQGPGCS